MGLENFANPSSGLPDVRRLGKNLGRYRGETIGIDGVLRDLRASAGDRGWEEDCFYRADDFGLSGFRRHIANARKRIYISAGIHGDEPAGPLAALELIRQDSWLHGMDVWLCPCLNPTGFRLNTRESGTGVDLNRDYLDPKSPEICAHVAWLTQQPTFDLALCLHEDWEAEGFYVYELILDSQPSFAEAIVQRVGRVCPIDYSPVIEGRSAQNGIIRPASELITRPQWPEAFYLINHKTRANCTLEAPSDFPLAVRVAALTAGVQAVIETMASHSH